MPFGALHLTRTVGFTRLEDSVLLTTAELVEGVGRASYRALARVWDRILWPFTPFAQRTADQLRKRRWKLQNLWWRRRPDTELTVAVGNTQLLLTHDVQGSNFAAAASIADGGGGGSNASNADGGDAGGGGVDLIVPWEPELWQAECELPCADVELLDSAADVALLDSDADVELLAASAAEQQCSSEDGEEAACAICLARVSREPFQLPCGHQFCLGCVRAALLVKPQCPMCRADVSKAQMMESGILETGAASCGALRSDLLILAGQLDGRAVDLRDPTDEMATRMHQVGICVASVCRRYSFHSLVSVDDQRWMEAVGLQTMTFEPYLHHLSIRSHMQRRIVAAIAGHAAGLRSQQTCAHADVCQALQEAIANAQYMLTAPLWLDSNCVEIEPAYIAIETTCKPEDAHEVKNPPAGTHHLFMTGEQFAAAYGDDDEDEDGDGAAPSSSQPSSSSSQPCGLRLPMSTLLLRAALRVVLEPNFLARAAEDECHADKWLAGLAFLSMILLNLMNERNAESFGCTASVARALFGCLVNYHYPVWSLQLAGRLVLTSHVRLAWFDDVPLSFEELNTEELKAISIEAFAHMQYKYQDVLRLFCRHVVCKHSPVHIDGAHDVKLLTNAYITGLTRARPSHHDVVKLARSPTLGYKDMLISHPICRAVLIVWGYGRTNQSYKIVDVAGNNHESDTHNRLHSALWAALGWQTQLVTGGLVTPDNGGGSAQGKAPVPADVQLPREDAALVYAQRRACAHSALLRLHPDGKLTRIWSDLVDEGLLRPVYPDFVIEQRLMASDWAALAALVYKYSSSMVYHGTSRAMMYHVCGPPANHNGWPPPHPVDVVEQWKRTVLPGLEARFVTPPPAHLWPRGGMPRWPPDSQAINAIRSWYLRTRVPAAVFVLRLTATAVDTRRRGGPALAPSARHHPLAAPIRGSVVKKKRVAKGKPAAPIRRSVVKKKRVAKGKR